MIIGVLVNSGKLEEAYALAERTLEAAVRARGPDDYHVQAMRGLVGESHLLRRWDVETARAMMTEAYEGQKRALSSNNWFTSQLHGRLAAFYANIGELDQAAREFDQVAGEFRIPWKPDNPTRSYWAVWGGLVHRERGDHRRCSALIQEAMDTWLKDYNPLHPSVLWCEAQPRPGSGRPQTARKIMELEKGVFPASHARPELTGLPELNRRLVEVYAGSGEVEKATKLVEEVIKDWQPLYKAKDRWAAGDRDMLARLLAGAFDKGPGPRDVPRALALAEANVKAYPKDGQLQTTLGIAQYRAKKYHDAVATLTQAAELDGDRRIAPRGFFLAMARFSTGEKEKARAAFDEAAAWMDFEGRPGHPALVHNRAEAAKLLGLKESGPPK